jgi:drug/metabolite transporter (DMT)-like permease
MRSAPAAEPPIGLHAAQWGTAPARAARDSPEHLIIVGVRALLALVAMTAVWGVTFVQIKDALEVYPLFAFLAVRFAIASATLAPAAARRLRGVGWGAGVTLGLLLALGYALQTAGLERTTVSSTGFITGLYVVFTPLFAYALFRIGISWWVAAGVALSLVGLGLLAGVGIGDPLGDLLVLGGSAAYSLQIALMERYAQRYDVVAFTFVEMLAAFAAFTVIAVALGELEVPRGWVVWGALIVTGVFASALGFLVQTWAQRRMSAARTALAFAMEPAWTALFGYWLAGDRLGALGWTGAALIMAGIVVAEPAAADTLRRLLRRYVHQVGRPR